MGERRKIIERERERGIDKEREFWLLFDGSEDEEKPLGSSDE